MRFADDPRSFWTPTISRVYGIRPWEMVDLLVSEYAAIGRDVDALNKAASGG